MPFAHQEIYEVMDLCLACKGCASECPSNVNVATLKAEFLHQYYKKHGIPFRVRAMANIGKLNQLGSVWPGLSNFFLGNKATSGIMKRVMGVTPVRSLPKLHSISLRKWFARQRLLPGKIKGQVYFFCDEFTNYNDTEIGIKAIQLLSRLGYQVKMIPHAESGRAYISKGLLKQAQQMAIKNVKLFSEVINDDGPLIGIEPSAILGFRDEYPKLVSTELRDAARKLAKNVLLIDEFLAREIDKGNIHSESFTQSKKKIKLHGHCHQKALSSVNPTQQILSLPANYEVEVIPSGCCGMAGSFGYEQEHYDVSMKIGELVLFPAVRSSEAETLIAAPGTSCRHQIKDGTGRDVLHPVEILWRAMK